MTRYRVGIDTGGTFTDLLAVGDDGGEIVVKVPSTPREPWRSLVHAVPALHDDHAVPFEAIELILHGTTVGINALLQGRYPPAGLLTTLGFGDILELARQTLPGERGAIYIWQKPDRIIPVSRVREVEGRLDARGDEVRPLDEDGVRAAARWFRDSGIRHIALSFINSYVNPSHERRARDLVLDEYPEATVVVSTETLPEFREYERTIATVMDTILVPVVSDYVAAVQRDLREVGVAAPLFLMKSSGGVATAARAAASPVRAALSGPVAAVLGLAAVAAQSGRENVITFDMGGTSTDVSLVQHSRPALVQEAMIGPYPLRVPTIDVASVGAGGGSIAWIAPGGFLKVGPQSAGADPGPACYGRGGVDATITDANVALGRLGSDLAGGAVRLDADLANAAVERFALATGLSAVEAAHGILEIACFNMADAVRQISVARGRDPRQFALVAAGGAGPLHAARLAEILDIPEVIIPPAPGVGRAVGLLAADVQEDVAVTAVQREEAVDVSAISDQHVRLDHDVRHRLEAQGFGTADIAVRRSADIRYRGQRTELTIPVPVGAIDATAFREVVHAFHQAYHASFGYDYEGEQTTELVTLRATGIVRLPKPEPVAITPRRGSTTPIGSRLAYFGGWIDTPIYARHDLVGTIHGPAIVEQYDLTTVIPPGFTCTTDAGSLILRRANAHHR